LPTAAPDASRQIVRIIAEHWDAITLVPADMADAWFAGEGPPLTIA
jgi:hypothetical protein